MSVKGKNSFHIHSAGFKGGNDMDGWIDGWIDRHIGRW